MLLESPMTKQLQTHLFQLQRSEHEGFSENVTRKSAKIGDQSDIPIPIQTLLHSK
jgi:hypothetical protein